MKRFWSKFAIIVGVWTALSLLLEAQMYFLGRAMRKPSGFWASAKFIFPDNWIWAALTPVVFWLAERFPFSRKRAVRTILIHSGLVLAVCGVHVAIAALLRIPMWIEHTKDTLVVRFLSTFYSDAWMYGTLVGLWNLIHFQRKYREREVRAAQLESQLTKAQLEVLKMQFQPHFLFNTLNSVSALMQDDIEGAEDMLADLSYMLRTSLRSTAGQEITLERELDLLRAYLRIQKRRFEDRLRVTISPAPETIHAKVPTFILQPLVENAIRHGIQPLSRAGNIVVSSTRVMDELILQVTDNGGGLQENYNEGIGLRNTRERLKQLYGETQAVRLSSALDKGTTVTITLPFREAEKEILQADDEDQDAYRGRRAARATTDTFTALD